MCWTTTPWSHSWINTTLRVFSTGLKISLFPASRVSLIGQKNTEESHNCNSSDHFGNFFTHHLRILFLNLKNPSSILMVFYKNINSVNFLLIFEKIFVKRDIKRKRFLIAQSGEEHPDNKQDKIVEDVMGLICQN